MRGRKPQVIAPRGPVSPVGEPPSYLTESQSAVWNELLEVAPPRVCTSTDRVVWEALVVAIDTFRIANESLKSQGLVIQAGDKSSYQVPNPFYIIRNKQGEQISKLAAQLGFDPTSRVRLNATAAAPPKSKLAELISRPA